MRYFFTNLFFVVVLAPFALATAAQTTEDESAVPLEETIVTATRRAESVMEVTQSIQAITETTLELPTFNEVSDVIRLVPGATGFSNKPPQEEGVQIRASGITQSAAGDGMSPVGYYVDDIPYVDVSTPVPPPIGTFDLDRIEVLRGPQGTTYGMDSSGGSVIMRTNPVDLENFGLKARVGASEVSNGNSGSGYTLGGVVNLPVVEGVFGLRIAYLREEDPGYGSTDGRPDLDEPLKYTRDSFRIKALWTPTDWASIEVTHSEWNTDYNILPATQVIESSGGEMIHREARSPLTLALFPNGQIKNDFEIAWSTVLAKFDLGFAELTSATGYVDTPKKENNLEESFDLGWGPLEYVALYNLSAESLTQEFRLVSTSDAPLQWILGTFYADGESNNAGIVDIPAFGYKYFEGDPIDLEIWAAYGDVEYALNEQWTIQGGMRYQDESRKDTYFQNIAIPGDPLLGPYSYPADPGTTSETSFDHLSFRGGLTWAPNDDTMVYLTHSVTNRAPVVRPLAEQTALATAGISAPGDSDKQQLANTELGAKLTLLDGQMQVEVAYVYQDWQDLPIWAEVNIAPQPLSMTVGGTEAEVDIFEVAVRWALTDNLTINYAGAFTDAEVTGTPSDNVSGYPAAIRRGGDLFNYSPGTHNFGLNWNLPMTAGWEIFAAANYVTREKPDGINVFDFLATEYMPARDSFENLSINFGASKGPWQFTLGIDNVTDFDGMYFPATANQVNGFIPAPTTISFQVIYDGMP